MHGSCNCGVVTVEANIPQEEKPNAIVCHCKNCKKTSGSVGACILILPLADLSISGPIKSYEDKQTDTGRSVHRHFCENCGSPVFGLLKEVFPDKAFVRTTLFDEFETAPPTPALELYTKDRWVWNQPIPNAHQVETQM
ncbi:uncharacterized protein PV06_07832 [Exophiala oligosperma]|uniref:CENP-V/GFA domain-containing protein n=1 Tax=Exophiala oligosperma TaxID=215243 RepID=A0A0D2DDY4_9EURO|nr:uncharacterized protein PV06_07832 [Exophiala oligosperma]KIW40655.1 hypothetical protein PV06_07832 [Exophiala oligosperma]